MDKLDLIFVLNSELQIDAVGERRSVETLPADATNMTNISTPKDLSSKTCICRPENYLLHVVKWIGVGLCQIASLMIILAMCIKIKALKGQIRRLNENGQQMDLIEPANRDVSLLFSILSFDFPLFNIVIWF